MSQRRTLMTGTGLVAVAAVVLLLDGILDLELGPVLLTGLAAGAVVGLVPGAGVTLRDTALVGAGLVSGVVLAWLGFVVRAGFVPDSGGGRAVVVVAVLVGCVLLALATRGLVPLWSSLVGVAALSGVYETTFTAAPAEVLDTSLTALTSLLLASACGLLAVVATAPAGVEREPGARRREHRERPVHNDPILEDVT